MNALSTFTLKDIREGLKLTFRYFFSKPFTIQYPDERRKLAERFRGLPYLAVEMQDGTWKEKCVACGLCEHVCPSNVITLEITEGPDGERKPLRYEMEIGRCLFCGLCAEACPVGALFMSRVFELANYYRESLIYDKAFLMDVGQKVLKGEA